MRRARTQRGMTLIELVVVIALSAILIGMVIIAMIDLDRTRKPRELSALIQGEGRSGLALIENDVRLASLGTSTGTVFLDEDGAREVPAVQIINDLPAAGSSATGAVINAKPGTDAILVVRAVRDPAVVVGAHYAMSSVTVHGPTPAFAIGDSLLLGDYGDSTWAKVTAVNSSGANTQLSLSNARIPSRTLTKLPAGAYARRAVARLYFVSPQDELVRVDLSSPRLSAGVTVSNREVIACPGTGAANDAGRGCGIENLQIGCQLDDGANPQPCPAALTGAIADDAAAAFGVTFGTGQGPRLSAAATQQTVSQLRTLSLSIVVRSGTPLIDSKGDPKIALQNGTAVTDTVTLHPNGVSTDDRPYVRRAYQLTTAVRNTSLGVL